MQKAEALFRMFFKEDAEYRAFRRKHKVIIREFMPSDICSIQFILEVTNDEGRLWSFNDKPASVVIDSDWNCAFLTWCQDVKHRDSKPAFVDITPESAITLEWWQHGKQKERQCVELLEMPKEQQEAEMWRIWRLIA
ncbi:MAG: hypothetical protein IPG77_04915 [Betaproteobacteria bacterium]|nr:hypothetical protein [Betaproteobacteria bacterium]